MSVQRWDIVTIGNLSRNRYWGESDDRGHRSAICTCTLLTLDDGTRILVDPSLQDEERMRTELDRRTGARLNDIEIVFITHDHGDHHFGLHHFSNARWLAASPVADSLNRSGNYDRPVEAVEGVLPGGIEILHTPGHTQHHYSLRFDCDSLAVVVAADAAMNRDFWNERQGYFNSSDFEQATRTIETLAGIADVIIPGHDNYFLNTRTRRDG